MLLGFGAARYVVPAPDGGSLPIASTSDANHAIMHAMLAR